MLNIGCHLSSSKGFYNMGLESLSIDANTFQFFTRNPRGGSAKEIDPADAQKLNDLMKEKGFAKILAHAPYTLNACAEKTYVREFAYNTMLDDLKRMEFVPNNMYNFHPGSHVGQGTEVGIDLISKLLNSILWKEQTTTVLLETMAGKGSEIGRSFEEIKDALTSEKLVVSIAAGVSTTKIEAIIPEIRVIRVMPNTPALVKLGMFGICKGSKASDDDLNLIVDLLSVLGKCITVEESQIDIVTAISGSGPAFFYQVIEDIARAGEKLGLDYEKSLILATQTALGSAQMVFNRGETTVQTLIDNVATKGGCTFVGITEMKEQHSDKLFYDVIDKTTQKANALGK